MINEWIIIAIGAALVLASCAADEPPPKLRPWVTTTIPTQTGKTESIEPECKEGGIVIGNFYAACPHKEHVPDWRLDVVPEGPLLLCRCPGPRSLKNDN